MKIFNFEKITEEGVKINRLWAAVLVLLLLVSVTSCMIGYLIGKTEKTDRFSGQIIDTITINAGHAENDDISKIYKVNIKGKVLYTDGRPYQNGTVELKSTIRYTSTDKYGRFGFAEVEEGKHTISVLENGTVLAAGTFIIEKTSAYSFAQITQLTDEGYLILSPMDLSVIQLVLELNEDKTILDLRIDLETNKGSQVDSTGEETPDGAENSETPIQPQEPDTPAEPVDPIKPVPSGGQSGGHGTPEATPPDLAASDDINPSQEWKQSTSVDIFAERAGNTGVQTIGGKNVIAPGSAGKYVFKIKNEEKDSILYSVDLSETDGNDPVLPMRYRLKAGVSSDGYVGGKEWKNAENIFVKGASLTSGEIVFFTLEWKWDTDDDVTDTSIGMQKETFAYILDIIISARSE